MDSKGSALDKEAAPWQLQFLCLDNLGHHTDPKVQREPFLGFQSLAVKRVMAYAQTLWWCLH
jgi:hypothetical protein